MSPLLALFLFLHVMGAIAVFGPSFAFPFLANQARKEPQHGHFAAVVTDVIERRLILPGVIVQGITGLVLIGILGANPLTDPAYRWLLIAIILYLIAITFSFLVQSKNVEKLVHLTGRLPAGGPPPADTLAQIQQTGKSLQRGGQILSVLLILIVLLMVTKPQF